MAVSLDTLVPEFATLVSQLIEICANQGVEMRPYAALRDPFEQAKLWRQSRSREEIEAQIAKFENGGAAFLAHCLRSAGPQHGDRVTNTPPGYSWHQWGEAVDCFWAVNGKAEWSTTKLVNGVNGYKAYAQHAAAVGITPGGHWKSFKDWPHVQQREESNVSRVMSMRDINNAMKARFG